LSCPFCYSKKKNKYDEILPLGFWESLIKVAAEMGIKKVALGGGEPTLVPGIMYNISKTAHIHGMEVSMTTNGIFELKPSYFDYFDGIAFSWDQWKRTYIDIVHKVYATKRQINHRLARNPMMKHKQIGINYLIENISLRWIIRDLAKFFEAGVDFVYFLLKKPNAHDPEDIKKLINALILIKEMDNWTIPRFGYDTSIMNLINGKPCAYGKDIITVYWDGRVYPCSFSHIPLGRLNMPRDLERIVKDNYTMKQDWKICPFLEKRDRYVY
jgi:MoaA/NifB/PqqE/SkfB family radical SAM enzyme